MSLRSNSTIRSASSSTMLDMTSESPMFPDAVQDNYVKSVSSRDSGRQSYRSNISCNRSASSSSGRGRPIPSHVSPTKQSHYSSVSNQNHNRPSTASNYSNPSRNSSQNQSRNSTQRDFSKASSNYMQENNARPFNGSTKSENPTTRSRIHNSHSMANSEPVRNNYSRNDYEMPSKEAQFQQHRPMMRQKSSNGDRHVGSLSQDSISEQRQGNNRTYRDTKFSHVPRSEHRGADHYHSNECHSEPNQLVSNGANIPETMSYKYRQNNHPSHYDENQFVDGDNHHIPPLYDDNSTIPSEAQNEYYLPKPEKRAVPSSIKCASPRPDKRQECRQENNEFSSGNHSQRQSSASSQQFSSDGGYDHRRDIQVSRSHHDFKEQVPVKKPLALARNHLPPPSFHHEANSSMYSAQSKVRRENRMEENNNVQTPSTVQRNISLRGNDSNLEMQIPEFYVVNSSTETASTAACTSYDSKSMSMSDKYLDHRDSKQGLVNADSYSTFSSKKSISRPIDDQFDNSSRQPSAISERTPVSSNTTYPSASKDKSNKDKSKSNGRLAILREICMAMEMRQKAKLSQEKDDYKFWINHIKKLNQELDALKFQSEDEDDDDDDDDASINSNDSPPPQPRPPQLHEKPVSVFEKKPITDQRPSQYDQMPARQQQQEIEKEKPMSILKKNTKKKSSKTIKIRAPADLKAGHVFKISVKGEEIQAIVVSFFRTLFLLYIFVFHFSNKE